MSFSVPSVAARIAADICGPVADDVDREGRLPKESLDALRAEGMLAVMVPASHGGPGASVAEVAAAVTELATACSSTAMIYAMHQIQVACLVRHERTPYLDAYLRRVVAEQPLLASATTELGVGGDIRTSLCSLEYDGDRFTLDKQAPVISYGEAADAVLATARRNPDSPPSDQCLVLCERPGLTLEARGAWDALGFRGTASLGFRLAASGPVDAVSPEDFGDILARTMLPVSHILWASVWLGMARAAIGKARSFVQAGARNAPESSPPAIRLAEAAGQLESLTALVSASIARFEALGDDEPGPGELVHFNSLKVIASGAVIDLVGRAMTICGMAGYRHDSPYSLGRLLRDAHGAAVMVNNDRIIANTASQVLLQRERR